jgi:hypothetical protein
VVVSSSIAGRVIVAWKKSIKNGGKLRYFASTTLPMQLITIPVAVINWRPRTVFTLTWGPVATTNEVVLPSLVRYGR